MAALSWRHGSCVIHAGRRAVHLSGATAEKLSARMHTFAKQSVQHLMPDDCSSVACLRSKYDVRSLCIFDVCSNSVDTSKRHGISGDDIPCDLTGWPG